MKEAGWSSREPALNSPMKLTVAKVDETEKLCSLNRKRELGMMLR